MTEIASGVYAFERPIKFLGLQLITRMTVLRLAGGCNIFAVLHQR